MDAPCAEHDTHVDRRLAILDRLRQFRFLTGRQLRLVTGCADGDLVSLEDAGAVIAFGLADPFRTGPPERVYALAKTGAHALVTHRGLDRSDVPYLTPGKGRRSLLTLEHGLGVAEVALAFEVACRRSPEVVFLAWEHRPERIGDAVFLHDDRRGALRVPIVADGFLVLRVQGRLHGFLIEVDRGTVHIPRMVLRYRGYVAWWRNGGPERKFGLRSLRVLTIASSEKRSERLRGAALAAIHRGIGSRFLWFAADRDVRIDAQDLLHAPIWSLAHERNGTRYPLLLPS